MAKMRGKEGKGVMGAQAGSEIDSGQKGVWREKGQCAASLERPLLCE